MSTLALRVVFVVLGFALGVGFGYALAYKSPPDPNTGVCPNCFSDRFSKPVFYTPDAPGKVRAVGPVGTVFDADPYSPVPRPVSGPKWHCTRCRTSWGPGYVPPGRR